MLPQRVVAVRQSFWRSFPRPWRWPSPQSPCTPPIHLSAGLARRAAVWRHLGRVPRQQRLLRRARWQQQQQQQQ
jgi:hypothetical protein